MAKKVQSISELFNQVSILTKGDTLEPKEVETDVFEKEETEETEDSVTKGDETPEEPEEPEEEEEKNNNESETPDEEPSGCTMAELSEKIDALSSDFNKYKGKVVSLLEAILAANRINLGLKETETPRLVIEKKKEGTLNTASGKLNHEVAALELYMNDDASLKIIPSEKYKFIKKGNAVENPLEINGKVPLGDWIVVERKEKYYLVSTENFKEAEDVTPYEEDEEDTNEKPTKGQVVNKKGVAHNVRGFELIDKPDYFKLTKESLNKPKKVFNAKWSNSDCNFPVKGETIPEGVWVIVIDDEGVPFLVKSDDVEPKLSTKKTEKEEPKKKKAVKKVASKKAVKKVAAKKPASKKVAKKKNKK